MSVLRSGSFVGELLIITLLLCAVGIGTASLLDDDQIRAKAARARLMMAEIDRGLEAQLFRRRNA